MKILITGGSGFIGTNFVSEAINRGHIIYNIDNLSLFQKDQNKKNKNYIFDKIDIRNKNSLNEIFNRFKPNKVIHMAAESHVDNSIRNPDDFITTNIMGTYNVLQASLEFFKSKNSTKNFCLHHVSTDEVFGSLKKNEKSFTEESKYKPNSPYSASKAGSDHLVRAWSHTYSLPCTITYCTNNFGPYQYPEKFIPVIILSGIMKKRIPIYGTGKNIRDWIFVQDHVNALLDIMEQNFIDKTYAIGSNDEKENIDIVDIICDLLDKKLDVTNSHKNLKLYVKDRLGHDFRYSINTSLIENEVKWKPQYNFLNGIKKTIDWYLINKDWCADLLKAK